MPALLLRNFELFSKINGSQDLCRPSFFDYLWFHGELQAIDLALETVTEAYPTVRKPVLLLSDCQGALSVTADPIAPTNFTGLYFSIQDKIDTLREGGSDLKLHWIAGHADIAGNEVANIKVRMQH